MQAQVRCKKLTFESPVFLPIWIQTKLRLRVLVSTKPPCPIKLLTKSKIVVHEVCFFLPSQPQTQLK